MWPFDKKKKPQISQPQKIAKSVICIPGTWPDWDSFKLSLISSSEMKYMAVGNILMDVSQKTHYTIEFCDHDPKMEKSFIVAGKVTRMSELDLVAIRNHTNVIYISTQTGNLEDAHSLAMAATAIVKTGGLGVKIESAGKAFAKEKWFELLETLEEPNLYEIFVLDSIIEQDGTVYSCGMHNLGLKDTVISGEKFQDAVDLIALFGYYQIIDKPTIHDNQTFSKDLNSSKFRITDERNQPNKGHELFENVYGMWRLTKI